MRRLREKVIGFLKQGMTPRDLALAFTLGVVLGTFPVLGATSLLCLIASVVLKINMPAIQFVNWIVSPLQLMLIITLFKLGSVLFGAGAVTVTLAGITGMMRTDLLGTIGQFLVVTVHAIFAWLLMAPLAATLLFAVFLRLFTRVQIQYVRIRADAGSHVNNQSA